MVYRIFILLRAELIEVIFIITNYFIKGFLTGFTIAAPVGPISVLCIRRTLALGKVSGFVSGLGAATADGFYGFVAAFGLTFISSFLLNEKAIIRLVGGLFLLYLGWTTFRSLPKEKAVSVKEEGLIKIYVTTLFLTITNPMTILLFGGIFAGLNTMDNYHSAGLTVLGVFLGSAFWWFILSEGINLFRNKFNNGGLKWVNRVSGLIIFTYGLFSIFSLIK